MIRRPMYATAAALGLLFSAGAALAQKSLDDLVLATVNGENITRGQLVARLVEYRGDDALEKMINRALLFQKAKALNLSVTEDEITKKLNELQEKFKAQDRIKGEQNYRNFLAQTRLKEDQLRDQMRQTVLIQKVALKETPFADKDLEQYDARMILAKDQATAEKWIKDLDKEKGLNFRQLAQDRNEDANLRKAGGHLRPFLKIEMMEVAQALDDQKVAVGSYTPKPVKLSSGSWAILKLEDRIPVSRVSAAERDRLTAAMTAYRVDQWITQTRTKAKVEKKPLQEPTVAVVEGEAIPRKDLITRLLEYQGQETLDQMVNRALLTQAAKKTGASISDAEADKKLAEVKGQFKTPEEFSGMLVQNNLTERQLREEIRMNLLMQAVALKEAPISDEDLTRYDVRMIVVPDKMTGEAWVKELEKGADFAEMATVRSLDEQGQRAGGRMRPFLKVELLDVWRALDEQKVKPGEFTKKPVLLTTSTWALLKLEAKVPPVKSGKERDELVARVTAYRTSQWLNQTRTAAQISFPVPLSGAVVRGT